MRRSIPHTVIDGVDHKYCKPCDQFYPLGEFNKKAASKDGYETKCKKCAKAKSAKFRQDKPNFDKEYQQKNLEKLKEYKRAYYLRKKMEKLS